MFTLDNFYQSKQWCRFREIFISDRVKHDKKSRMMCEHCGCVILEKYDCILHHKEELTAANINNLNISLNPSNIMMVHRECHDEIHGKNGYQHNKEVYIVYGSPCSGKNHYVNTLLKRNDIVIDMDMIYHCINPHNELYDKPERLYLVAKTMYDRLLECVFNRTGYWQRAYILTTENLPTQLDRMCEKYGAKLIHIDTPKEQCVSNLLNDEAKYLYRDKWMEYINKYWDTYTPYL